MKTFKSLSEVGRGRLLFQSLSDERIEELFRATTNEYILCRRKEEIILPNQAAAIQWSVDRNLCDNKSEFLKRCTEIVRIPWKSVIPEVRPYCDGEVELESPIDPNLRIEELIQHPIYNTCILQHDRGEEVIRLNDKQRKKVMRYVQRMLEGNYAFKQPIHLSKDTLVCESAPISEQFVHSFSVSSRMDKSRSPKNKKTCLSEMKTFVAFTGKHLPHYFDQRDFDELTWLKIDNTVSLSQRTLNRSAMIAVAVNMYNQVDYEYLWTPAMYPLEILQDLGILPYEDPEPHDY